MTSLAMYHGREDRHPHVIAIVDKIKSEGIFDALRKDYLADVDTKVRLVKKEGRW